MLVALVAFACKSVPIEDRPPIAVPAGLTANDVELAILYDLAQQNFPTDLTPGQQISNNQLKALLLTYRSVDGRKPGWYPESAQPGLICAGYDSGRHYLRVSIQYDDTTVKTRIIESRGLDQESGRIHKSAIRWLDGLEVQIRRALGQIAAAHAIDGREPAAVPRRSN